MTTTTQPVAVQGYAVPVAEHWPVDPETYHRCLTHASNSMVSDFIKSPLLFHGRYVEGRYPRKTKSPMVKGTAVHENILLPGRFESNVVEIPTCVLTANGSKAGSAWKEFQADHPGKLLLKSAELAEVLEIVAAIRMDDTASALLSRPGQSEFPIRWIDDDTGLPRRAMLDYFIPDDNLFVDLKAISDNEPRAFANKCLEFGYHRQHPYYADGAEALTSRRPSCVFITVLSSPPYSVRCYELDERFVGLGTDEVRGGLRMLSRLWGRPAEVWRDVCSHEIETLSPPNYAFDTQWRTADE